MGRAPQHLEPPARFVRVLGFLPELSGKIWKEHVKRCSVTFRLTKAEMQESILIEPACPFSVRIAAKRCRARFKTTLLERHDALRAGEEKVRERSILECIPKRGDDCGLPAGNGTAEHHNCGIFAPGEIVCLVVTQDIAV